MQGPGTGQRDPGMATSFIIGLVGPSNQEGMQSLGEGGASLQLRWQKAQGKPQAVEDLSPDQFFCAGSGGDTHRTLPRI